MYKTTHRYVERGRVQGIEWMRSHCSTPEGLVIAPPLIGGHAIQQLRLLRPLVRRHLDIFSFSFAGHGASKGAFSLQAALENSVIGLDAAVSISRRQGLPLYGIASCFGAIPLLHAIEKLDEPLDRLVLINALPHLRWEKMVAQFLCYWRTQRQWRLTVNGVKAALKAYRDHLLPRVAHGRHAFGILPRQRVHWIKMIRDLFAFRQFKATPLNLTPVLCVYAQRDRLLQHAGFDDWKGYESLIKRICPRAQFCRIDSDHFLTGPAVRERLVETVTNFFQTVPNADPALHISGTKLGA